MFYPFLALLALDFVFIWGQKHFYVHVDKPEKRNDRYFHLQKKKRVIKLTSIMASKADFYNQFY